MNLDTSKWKPFLLHRLYDIRMGNKFDKNKLDEDSPEVNLVSRVSYNNGVDVKVGYVDGVDPFSAGLVTVALGGSYLGSCFVQEEPFYTAQNVAVMTPNEHMTHDVNLFISGLVRFESKVKYYAFGRELNTHIKTDFDVKLPIQHTDDGTPVYDNTCRYSDDGYIPDWKFMENYIKSLHQKPLTTKNRAEQSRELHTENWKEFTIGELFTVKYGVNLELNACEECEQESDESVNFVARTAKNNGVTAHVSIIEGVMPQKAGLITVAGGGSVLSAFYQPEPFYSGRDLYVLSAKQDISIGAKLFAITVIEQNKYRFSYGRQANKTLPNLVIKLPADTDGNPDWQFMENYIKSLPYGDRLNG